MLMSLCGSSGAVMKRLDREFWALRFGARIHKGFSVVHPAGMFFETKAQAQGYMDRQMWRVARGPKLVKVRVIIEEKE